MQNNNKQNTTRVFAAIGCIAITLYLFLAFIYATLDIKKFSMEAKTTVCLVFSVFCIAILATLYGNNKTNNNDAN